jgi:hypothetical protein
MTVIGFSSNAHVMCPACVVARFGTLALGLFTGQGEKDAQVACSFNGVPHLDGKHGVLHSLTPDDLACWEPWGATCDRCKKGLGRGALPRFSTRLQSSWARLTHRRFKPRRDGSPWARALVLKLVPSSRLTSAHGPNRPAACPVRRDG